MTYFFDTNILLSCDKGVLSNLETKFFISNITINELENIKSSGTKDETVKYNARKILHWLDENPDKFEVIIFKKNFSDLLNLYDLPDTADSKIIATAYYFYVNEDYKYENKRFVTNDLACKAIAKSIGVPVEQFNIEDTDEYTGFKEVVLNDEELSNFYTNSLPNNDNCFDLYNNEYLIIKNNNKIVDKYVLRDGKYIQIPFIKVESNMFGKICPKDGDPYQQIALETLTHNQISMLRGPAGSGKSYLSFGYMFSLLEKGKIDKIVVFCNTVATKGSAKLGFYPGTRSEKLLDSQIGNLLESKLGDRYVVEKLIADNKLILLPISDIRGYDTSGMNCAVYISEAQNLDIELMRLVLQRIGEDSICILDGDSNAQVDLDLYAGDRNGMRRVSKIFRGEPYYGEVTLQSIKRSRIAARAQLL